MLFLFNHSKRVRVFVFCALILTVLFIDVVWHINLVKAGLTAGNEYGEWAAFPTRTRHPTKAPKHPTHTPFYNPPAHPGGVYPRLCGKLVFFVNEETGVGDIGLIPCSGSSRPYIFSVHPRDIVGYYQFRDVSITQGEEIKTARYGCLDEYISSFQNYIGIDSCAACGKNVPPTWTQAPLTPYTSTPRPPTSTPYIPSPTLTLTPTLARWQMTQPPQLFDLLSTRSPEPSLESTPTRTATPVPLLPAALTPAPAGAGLWRSPLVLGIGFILVMLVLAYLVWLSVMRGDRD